MRIVCPSCEAVYQVPDATLAKARVMRCARCAQVFEPPVVEAEAAEELPPPFDEPLVEPAPVLDHAPPAAVEVAPAPSIPSPRPWPAPPAEEEMEFEEPVAVSAARRAAVLGAWAVSLAVVAALVTLGVVYRQQVMHAWPASARLYAAVRLRF